MNKNNEKFLIDGSKNFMIKIKDINYDKFIWLNQYLEEYANYTRDTSSTLYQIIDIIKPYPDWINELNNIIHPEFKIPTYDYNNLWNELLQEIMLIFNKIENTVFEEIIKLIMKFIEDNKKEFDKNIFMKTREMFKDNTIRRLIPNEYMNEIFNLIDDFEEYKDYKNIVNNLILLIKSTLNQNKENNLNLNDIKKIKPQKKKIENKIDENFYYREEQKKNIDEIWKNEKKWFTLMGEFLNKEQYNVLLKLIYLFNKSIIANNELIHLSQNILINVDKNICIIFKELLEFKEINRNMNSNFNKKYWIDNDFKFEKNLNLSYRKINKDFPKWNIYTKNEISNKNINIIYQNHQNYTTFGIPDDNTKKKIFKNNFEENLLKIENEIFELDSYLELFSKSLLWINKIIDSPINRNVYFTKLKNFNTWDILFGKNKENIIGNINDDNIEIVFKKIKKRLEEKIDIMKKIKNNNLNNTWKENLEKNYFKSLDIKSHSLKYHEKFFLSNKFFIDNLRKRKIEIKNLLKNVKNSNDLFNSVNLYLKPLNTFNDLMKNNDLYSHENINNYNFNKIILLNNLPYYILLTKNKYIWNNLIFILIHYINNSKLSVNEKERVKKFYLNWFENYFEIKYNEEEFEKKWNLLDFENELIDKLEVIEKFNEDKKYEYFVNIKEKYLNKKTDSKLNSKSDENELNSNIIKRKKSSSKNNTNNTNEDGSDIEKEINSENKIDEEFFKMIETSQSEHFIETNSKKFKLANNNTENETFILPNLNIDKNKSFYGNIHIYLIITYLYYLYERFEFANQLSYKFNEKFQNNNLFELFISLIYNLNKQNIDYYTYEESIKILFSSNSGIFLNLEKIETFLIKLVPQNDLVSIIFNEKKYSENLNLTLLSNKLFEINNLNNKVSKNINTNNYLINNNNIFRFLFHNNKIYINKIKNNNNLLNLKDVKNQFENFKEYCIKPIKNFNKNRINDAIFKNNIHNTGIVNKNKLFSNKINQEDYIFRPKYNNLNIQSNNVEKQLKKIIKMRSYLNKRIN